MSRGHGRCNFCLPGLWFWEHPVNMVRHKSAISPESKPGPKACRVLNHDEEMRELEKGAREITRSRETALAFLYGAGLVTKSGKPKRLLRG